MRSKEEIQAEYCRDEEQKATYNEYLFLEVLCDIRDQQTERKDLAKRVDALEAFTSINSDWSEICERAKKVGDEIKKLRLDSEK